MKNKFEGVSSDYRGVELEEAYAKVIGGTVRGGFGDGGLDIINIAKDIPVLQVKNSWQYASSFLAESRRRKQFIPIVVGELDVINPNLKYEILDSIRRYGGWISHDIPDHLRDQYLAEIVATEKFCTPPPVQKVVPEHIKKMFGLK